MFDRCLRVIYPQTCYFCGKINKTPICDTCKEKIVYINEPRCKKCGKPIRYLEKEFCEDCQKRKFSYEQGRSIWLHKGPVAWSVYQFKYHNRRIFGEFYAKELWRLYGDKMKEWGVECIIPVPLHPKRRRQRGYNQAEIIAGFLGDYAGLPVCRNAVRRVRYTERQKKLDNRERRKNLKDAFQVSEKWKPVKKVLLIDDIYTTGNTIDEISQKLRGHGVEKIWFLTISIGQGF